MALSIGDAVCEATVASATAPVGLVPIRNSTRDCVPTFAAQPVTQSVLHSVHGFANSPGTAG
jgi:hypothetical protein